MKILHLGATYPPYHGGMGNVMKEEAARLVMRGHSVTVVTLAPPGEAPGTRVEEGATVTCVRPQIRWGKAGLSWSFVSSLRDPSFDVVHVHLPFFGLQELLAVLFWLGKGPKKLVASYHMDIVASGFVKLVAQISRRFFLPTVIKRAHRVLVASKDYASKSWAHSAEQKMHELPFGVDLLRFSPDGHEVQEVKKLLFLGGLDTNHYFKGLAYALNALQGLCERSDWRLDVVGDGDLREGYEKQMEAMGLEDRVTFLGRVSEEKVPELYRQADVFLFPSTDRSEAFGLVALEAQASGVPVIASDLDGVRDVIADQETGWLVSPKDTRALREAIAHALDDADRLPAMKVAARKRAEQLYGWDRHVNGLVKQYQDVCGS